MRKQALGLVVLGSLLSLPVLAQTEGAVSPVCGAVVSCDAAAPAEGLKQGFFSSNPKGKPFHFGKDFYFNESEDQWVIAKFQYGNALLRAPLVHEEISIQLLRGCGSEWETMGRAFTTAKGEHGDVLRTRDDGGMVYFKLTGSNRLGVGRHRVRLVASGDQSAVELFIEILPTGSTLFVSDVDGTLTKGELTEGLASIIGQIAPAHDGAADLFRGLARKGYHPLYLTARASLLIERTREFIAAKEFPAGIIQTSEAGTLGISGDKAVAFKSAVLQGLEDSGFRIAYAFGNTAVDARSFASIPVPDEHKFFYKYDDFAEFGGGVSHMDYSKLDSVNLASDICAGF